MNWIKRWHFLRSNKLYEVLKKQYINHEITQDMCNLYICACELCRVALTLLFSQSRLLPVMCNKREWHRSTGATSHELADNPCAAVAACPCLLSVPICHQHVTWTKMSDVSSGSKDTVTHFCYSGHSELRRHGCRLMENSTSHTVLHCKCESFTTFQVWRIYLGFLTPYASDATVLHCFSCCLPALLFQRSN